MIPFASAPISEGNPLPSTQLRDLSRLCFGVHPASLRASSRRIVFCHVCTSYAQVDMPISACAPEAGTLAWLCGGAQLEISNETVYAPPGELTMMLEGLGGGRGRVGRRQWERPSEGPPIARGVTVYAAAPDFADDTKGGSGGETIFAASAIRRRVNPAPQPPRAPLEPVNEGEVKAEAEGMHPPHLHGIADGQPRSSVGSASSSGSPQPVEETVYEASNYGAVLAPRAAAAPPPRYGNGFGLPSPHGAGTSPPHVSPFDDGKASRPAWDPTFADESPFVRGFGAPPPPRQRASAVQPPRRRRPDSNPRREGLAVELPMPDGGDRRLPGAWDAACIDATRAYDDAFGGAAARPHSTPEKKRMPADGPALRQKPTMVDEPAAAGVMRGDREGEREYADLLQKLEMRMQRNGVAVAGGADEARKVHARRKKRLVSDEVGPAACCDIGGINCPPRPPPKAPPCPSVVDAAAAAAARLPEKKARAKADPSDPETRQMFDKRRSRKDNRAPFEAAVAQWRLANAAVPRPSGSVSGSGDGGVSVFARKRPLFSHEMSRGEYDVVTVASAQEIVVHNCQMHADLKRMIIKHQASPNHWLQRTREVLRPTQSKPTIAIAHMPQNGQQSPACVDQACGTRRPRRAMQAGCWL